jgi:hypothetical protein
MRIDPVYRPSDDGTILVYQGDLLLSKAVSNGPPPATSSFALAPVPP